MRLELTAREADVLASLLETTLSDLSYEIANTDGLDYREKLKARRAVLLQLRDAVLVKLATEVATSGSPHFA